MHRAGKKGNGALLSQWGQELYTAIPGFLDKGHMAKREDVQWGDTKDEAQLPSDSTIFYSNAVAQHKDLNRKIWKRLENYILHRETTSKNLRICVFHSPYPPYQVHIRLTDYIFKFCGYRSFMFLWFMDTVPVLSEPIYLLHKLLKRNRF